MTPNQKSTLIGIPNHVHNAISQNRNATSIPKYINEAMRFVLWVAQKIYIQAWTAYSIFKYRVNDGLSGNLWKPPETGHIGFRQVS